MVDLQNSNVSMLFSIHRTQDLLDKDHKNQFLRAQTFLTGFFSRLEVFARIGLYPPAELACAHSFNLYAIIIFPINSLNGALRRRQDRRTGFYFDQCVIYSNFLAMHTFVGDVIDDSFRRMMTRYE